MADPNTVLGLSRVAWIAIITPIVVGALAWGGKARAREESGWKVLRPTIALYIINGFACLMAIFFMVSTAIVLLAWGQAPLDRSGVLVLMLGPPLTAMFVYAAAYFFLTHIRFNDSGVERQFLRKTTFVAWNSMSQIRRHFFFGPQIMTTDGRQVAIWEYWRGFRDLIDTATAKGVPVDIGEG